tara:strand:- start:14848 stop:15363 length:516 start_codon:yes stop_codon:yes gene_type:complete
VSDEEESNSTIDDEETEITDVEDSENFEQRIKELLSDLQYAKAETVNVRQRGLRDKAEAIRYGASNLAARIIPCIDNLEMALKNSESDNENITEGVRMTLSKLKSALSAEGIVRIETEDEKFDPTKMEAIATIPSGEEIEPGSIIEVVEVGYMYHDRVLRAARVIVAEALQ